MSEETGEFMTSPVDRVLFHFDRFSLPALQRKSLPASRGREPASSSCAGGKCCRRVFHAVCKKGPIIGLGASLSLPPLLPPAFPARRPFLMHALPLIPEVSIFYPFTKKCRTGKPFPAAEESGGEKREGPLHLFP